MSSNVGGNISVGDATLAARDVAKVLGNTGNMFGRTAAKIRIWFQLGEWVSQESLEEKIEKNEGTAKKIYAAYITANVGQVPTEHTKQILVFKRMAMATQQGSSKASGTPEPRTPEERAKYIKDNWMSFVTDLSSQPEGRFFLPTAGPPILAKIKDQKQIVFLRGDRLSYDEVSFSLDQGMIYNNENPQGLSIESEEGKRLLNANERVIYATMSSLLQGGNRLQGD